MSIILETKESNPLVCSLMSEIFTDRPSLIRSLLAWNEEFVLDFTKVLGSRFKILFHKNSTMFKAITSVSEISATHHFTNPTKVGKRVIPFLSWLFSNQQIKNCVLKQFKFI